MTDSLSFGDGVFPSCAGYTCYNCPTVLGHSVSFLPPPPFFFLFAFQFGKFLLTYLHAHGFFPWPIHSAHGPIKDIFIFVSVSDFHIPC